MATWESPARVWPSGSESDTAGWHSPDSSLASSSRVASPEAISQGPEATRCSLQSGSSLDLRLGLLDVRSPGNEDAELDSSTQSSCRFQRSNIQTGRRLQLVSSSGIRRAARSWCIAVSKLNALFQNVADDESSDAGTAAERPADLGTVVAACSSKGGGSDTGDASIGSISPSSRASSAVGADVLEVRAACQVTALPPAGGKAQPLPSPLTSASVTRSGEAQLLSLATPTGSHLDNPELEADRSSGSEEQEESLEPAEFQRTARKRPVSRRLALVASSDSSPEAGPGSRPSNSSPASVSGPPPPASLGLLFMYSTA